MPILPKKKRWKKWPFLDQNHGLTTLEKFPFFDFLKFYFCSLERSFFVVKYRIRHFPGLYCLKKKVWKNGNFWTKTMGLLKNVKFLTFWTSCFYSLERLFFVLEYRERHCHCLYCLKKKVGLIVIFGQKPWVNPFVKKSIFRLF